MRTGRLGELNSSFVDYLVQRTCHSARPDWSPGISSSVFLSRRIDSSRDLYHKDLYAHYGCVNAIEFSTEGDLLVSGGDDRRVLLWNIDGVLSENRQPHAMKGEHSSNIFCLSFDSSNSKIFSAGNDEQVIVHDLRTGDLVDVFLHREAVYGVSVNPTLDSVFASAGEDGQILMYDMRESPVQDPVCLARYHDAFHSVQFHPLEPTFIVTANSREGVALWDVRKPKVPVVRYGEKQCAQSSMCAKFNRMGTQIVALRRRQPPILYATQYSKPVSEFDAEHYYNSCTMKSCSFAGDQDQFVLSGSDDFNLYMWKIPLQADDYFVSEAHMVLKGHRSIVNQVRFNPQNFIIASSGVEKIVKLWSAVSLPGSKGSLQTKSCSSSSNSRRSLMSRRVYTYEEYIGLVMESGQDVNHDYSHGSTDEDPRMMAFFDSLVQRELEGWTSNTDLSDDDDRDLDAALTSQSDDNNDSPYGPSRQRQGRRSAATEGRGRAHSSSNDRTRRSSRDRPPQPDGSTRKDDDDEDNDEDGESNKVSGASEWIMCMITKKRAQLRAASARRRRKNNCRTRSSHRITTQQQRLLLSSYTANRSRRRRYLYHPEEAEEEEEEEEESLRTTPSQGNGRSDPTNARVGGQETQQRLSLPPSALPSASSVGTRRRHSFRRYMAPYTIMVVDSDLLLQGEQNDSSSSSDSDNEPGAAVAANSSNNNDSSSSSSSSSEDSDDGGQVSSLLPQQNSSGGTNSVNKRKRHLWSPGSSRSSSSDEDDRCLEKRTHVDFSNLSDLENGTSSSLEGARNGHVNITSEIADDSNASESEVEISGRNGVAWQSLANSLVKDDGGEETGGRVAGSSDGASSSSKNSGINNVSKGINNVSNGVSDVNNGGVCNQIEESEAEAIPIRSVSVDDNGSVSFGIDNSSLVPSSVDIKKETDSERESVRPSTSSSDERRITIQNGATNRGDAPAIVLDKKNGGGEKELDVDQVETNGSVEEETSTDNCKEKLKKTFSFKKHCRVRSLRNDKIRNYRKREDEDDEDL